MLVNVYKRDRLAWGFFPSVCFLIWRSSVSVICINILATNKCYLTESFSIGVVDYDRQIFSPFLGSVYLPFYIEINVTFLTDCNVLCATTTTMTTSASLKRLLLIWVWLMIADTSTCILGKNFLLLLEAVKWHWHVGEYFWLPDV